MQCHEAIVFKSFKVHLANLIINGRPRLRIFYVSGNLGSKVVWRCWGSNPDPPIPTLMP